MSTPTTNYNLIKPELTDPADITQMNVNWDKLDQVIKANLDEAKEYTNEKVSNIPTPDVSGQINDHNNNTSSHSDIRSAITTAQNAANTAQSTASTAQSTATTALNTANTKAPMYSYGTDDLTPGSSPLETGKLHFVYE